MAPEVQNARTADVPALVELYHRAYEGNKRIGFPSSVLECGADDVAEWIHNRRVLVAIDAEEIVGVVQIIPRPEWNMPEIGRLAVSPDHQTQGVGTLLLESAEESLRAEGRESVRLRTLSGHPFLEDWYRRAGYERVGIERLSDRPYDAPIMEKGL
ncbi:GNAT family N-acetyltransferase [Haloarcula laminariae]|uniref:GNAT family N-acetyltransferase n=1 Tax=Haloarcula laminariae TaxID=2961577 RepID=UPI0021C57D33|nr:GNAT family N-acetyltransferase [Halomicroarcula sp. FL173]